MRWIDFGCFFTQSDRQYSDHAQLPVVDAANDRVWKIYYSTRDKNNHSIPMCIDVQAGKPENILKINCEPLFQPGPKGSFDQHGVMPTEVLHHQGQIWIYFIGWNQNTDYPFQNQIGVALLQSNGNWKKFPQAIIKGHNQCNYTGTLGIYAESDKLYGYYLCCTDWIENKNSVDPCYRIDIATSIDGINWQQPIQTAIPFSYENEGGIVSARVIKQQGFYHMWYAFRFNDDFRHNPEKAYRLGYAQSVDAISWQRRDNLMCDFRLNHHNKDWANTMCSYPYLVEYQDTIYLFYNGNGFGQTGIGYATLPIGELPAYVY